MNAGENRVFLDGFAGFGEPVNPDVIIDAGFFREPATAQIADDFADEPRVALRNEPRLFGFQFDNHRRGVVECQLFVERTQICALNNEHFIPFFSRRAGGKAIRSLVACGGERFGFARLDEQMSGAVEDEQTEVVYLRSRGRQSAPAVFGGRMRRLTSAATRDWFQTRHAFLHFQPVAGGAAQRRVHVRENRARVHTAFIPERNHHFCEFAGIGPGLHERGTAEFHVEDERVEAFGELFGKDGRGDERDAGHGAGNVAERVNFLVRRNHPVGLTADDTADFLHLLNDFSGGQHGFEAGNGIELVERAAGDAQAAPGNHWHAETEAREQWRERQRDLVADAAGGMLVHERAFVPGEFQHIAGIAHGERERGDFGGGQPAKINGHEHRGHLVVGNCPGGELADEFLNLFRREGFAFAFGFDERKKVHDLILRLTERFFGRWVLSSNIG